MKFRYLIFIISFFLFSCGGDSENKNVPSVTNFVSITAENVESAVGFEILIYSKNVLHIEKGDDIKNWEIKAGKDKNKVRILAFSKDLKPVGKNTADILHLEISKDGSFFIEMYKFVDEFGNPIDRIRLRKIKF